MESVRRFREQLVGLLPKPEGVSLVTVESREEQSLGVEVLYDADSVDAGEWVKQAVELSAEMWQKVAERRTGVRR